MQACCRSRPSAGIGRCPSPLGLLLAFGGLLLIVPGEAEAKKSGSPPKQKADVQQPAKPQRQQASKTAKGKPDDDDDDDGSDGKNDTGAGRVDRSVTGNVN